MKAGKYTLADFYSHRNFEQIIIPEIQRDYVWGIEQIEPFLIDLNKEFVNYNSELQKLKSIIQSPENLSLEEQFLEFKLKQNCSYNIGFIYAYQDDEYPGHMFLIDGQQRFTTIYLLALVLAVKEQNEEDFKKKFIQKNNRNRFDYRVRNSASEFLQKFTDLILNLGLDSVKKISVQHWYFSDYNQDTTIQNILNAFTNIVNFINDEESLLTYDFVNNYVDFWYFDTNISEQGEELYIYMNARGEAVQENENIKANLLSKLPNDIAKNEYGTKWENWQNFFWTKRGINKNADNGFDEFLRWILIIKAAEKKKNEDTNYKKLLEGKLVLKNIEEIVSLSEIENYYKALQYIFIDFQVIASEIEVEYEAKFHKYKSMILSDWLVRDKDSKSYEVFKKSNNEEYYFLKQINLFRLLPVLEFVNQHFKNQKEIDNDNLYRLVRYFYNISRTDNVGKAVRETITSGIELVNKLVINPNLDITSATELSISKTILSAEESNKLNCYKLEIDNSRRRKIENAFWYCEDFELSNATIEFVLSCVMEDTDNIKEGINDEDLELFVQYNLQFQNIFKNRNDKLRQAILTFDDYTIWDGSTPSLGGNRFSFGYTKEQWLKILANKQKTPIKELLNHFVSNNINVKNIEVEIQKLILDYNKAIEDKSIGYSWEYEFTKDTKSLEYCQKKNFCWIDENNIYLLLSEKATEGSYKKLKRTNIK